MQDCSTVPLNLFLPKQSFADTIILIVINSHQFDNMTFNGSLYSWNCNDIAYYKQSQEKVLQQRIFWLGQWEVGFRESKQTQKEPELTFIFKKRLFHSTQQQYCVHSTTSKHAINGLCNHTHEP